VPLGCPDATPRDVALAADGGTVFTGGECNDGPAPRQLVWAVG
jgi:hypothetical protein